MTINSHTQAPAVFALYLPQYYQTSYNDEWWGEGYTEWTACKKANPLYNGHYQPRVPQHGNYYDLSDPKNIAWQATLAREYGIDGFALYHYYSLGNRLLDVPVEALLAHDEIEVSFYLYWANESWRKAWFGQDPKVVWKQEYGDRDDWAVHFRYCLPFFQDRRYYKIDGKPVFAIYKDNDLPDSEAFISLWNSLAKEAGLPGIFFIKTADFWNGTDKGPYDAIVTREPVYTNSCGMSKLNLLKRKVSQAIANVGYKLNVPDKFKRVAYRGSYERAWENILNREVEDGTVLGAFCDWDNSPRRGYNSIVMDGATPDKFGMYMERLFQKAEKIHSPMIVVNAWNEWAEGAYLEPDERYGDGYLAAVRDARLRVCGTWGQ